jgi:glycosyltransferase involved in cell wall biosynthesis
MKVGIYSDFSGGALGGGDSCLAVLAADLQREHEVTIIHHAPTLTREKLEEYFRLDLSQVEVRYVEPDYNLYKSRYNLLKRRRQVRSWRAEVSAPYDLFVATIHYTPPFCHARYGVLYVLFPMELPDVARIPGRLGAALQWYTDAEWRARMHSYDRVCAISEFSARWTERYWWNPAEVVYPPVRLLEPNAAAGPRDRSVLCVGRFTTAGNRKRQRELVEAFSGLESDPAAEGWQMRCIGGLSDTREDREYFASVKAAAGERVTVEANLSRAEIEAQFRRSALFWHGAGYGSDPDQNPEAMEHFGIATVEAMSSGCVPLVIRRGGQPEIVEHGVSGFVWETLDELRDYSLLLMRDDALRAQMSCAAIRRAARFSEANYVSYFRGLIREIEEERAR